MAADKGLSLKWDAGKISRIMDYGWGKKVGMIAVKNGQCRQITHQNCLLVKLKVHHDCPEKVNDDYWTHRCIFLRSVVMVRSFLVMMNSA